VADQAFCDMSLKTEHFTGKLYFYTKYFVLNIAYRVVKAIQFTERTQFILIELRYLDLHDTIRLSNQKIKKKFIYYRIYDKYVFSYRLVFVAICAANVQINIHSLYRIRTGLHDVEDLDGYLESINAEGTRMSTYIQCLWHKVKNSRYLGVTASNACSDGAGIICFLSEVTHRVNDEYIVYNFMQTLNYSQRKYLNTDEKPL
jgi:hypothetical protein